MSTDLPARPGRVPGPRASVPAMAGSDGAAAPPRIHRVVIVDDTPDIRDLLALIMERAPEFAVVGQAADGRAGIAVAARERPDVVLLDLAMPVMDGLEALPRLRALLPEAAIVVLSGFGTGAMANQAFRAGADAYVEKGTSAQRIVERVREAITGRLSHEPDAAPPPLQVLPATGNGAATVEAVHDLADASTAPMHSADAPRADDEVTRLRRAIATTAHEIRNPVTVLRGVLEAFTDEAEMPRERQERLIAAVGRQIQQLDSICTDLLTAAHARRGRLEVAPATFDLLGALREIIGDRPGVRLRHEPMPTLPVWADRGRLEQMVLNLLTNAAKYGAPPIEVRARHVAGDRVAIAVSDEGPGVPVDFRERLFDEFARADTAAQIAGNGLGLFVVKRLAEAHGGSVRYADRPGGGAVFTIDVPTGQ